MCKDSERDVTSATLHRDSSAFVSAIEAISQTSGAGLPGIRNTGAIGTRRLPLVNSSVFNPTDQQISSP